MVYETKNHLVSRRCRSSGILNTRKQRFGDWIRFRPQVRGETQTQLGGDWSASLPGRFTSWRKNPCYSWDRRLGGSQSRSGWPYWVSNSDLSTVHPIASRCAACDIPAPVKHSWLWNATNNTSVLSHLFARYCCRDTVMRSYDLCVSQTVFQHVNCSDMRPFYYPWNKASSFHFISAYDVFTYCL
jgi:hypothetical protein